MDAETSSSSITVMLYSSGLSLAALFYLFQKHVSGRALLPYEPRLRVPWGAAVALLAMAMPLLGVAAYLLVDDQPPAEKVPPETQLVAGWGNFTFMIFFVAGVMAWLATFLRADARDLGLPTSWRQLVNDAGIGIFATVAALLPIYAVQLTLINALQMNTPHPLVKQIQENHSPAMLVLGFAMAVIAAPLFEEFTFRGLLQGWLERSEDAAVGYDATLRHRPILIVESEEDLDNEINEAASIRLEPETVNSPRPTHGWIPDLPHGWTPILISGIVFGVAHIGHGVAPVSLVLFGIVLGYLYQRTHRLVPSITAHILFNGYSMVLLWLQLEAPTVP